MDDTDARDRAILRDKVEAWAVWRDSGQWDKLLTLWHDDSIMSATWQQSSGAEFVASSRAAWARGVDVQHFLGGAAIDIVGDRAIVQTKMTIGQRSTVHDVLVDVTCEGRFYDFFERRAHGWGIVWRQPIYERDRMDPVPTDAALTLDQELLDSFPVGYRYLGYLQTQAGMTIKRDMPGRMGPEVDNLYARGAAWLVGRQGHPTDSDYLAG